MGETHGISLRERIRLNLLSAMEQAAINQVQLAEKLGISKGTVNNWARGNNSPDVDMVPKICKVLEISISDLYSPTKFEPQEYVKKEAPLYSSEALKLAQDYDCLDSHGKRIVRLVTDEERARCEELAADRRPMIRAAARSGGVTEIEAITPDEVADGEDIP